MFNPYVPFVIGLVLVCGISFWDDVRSLPDSVRLVVQFVATGLMFCGLMGQGTWFVELAWYWKMLIGLVALNIPIGQWHTVRVLESGTVILECKDGPYEPLGEEDAIVSN